MNLILGQLKRSRVNWGRIICYTIKLNTMLISACDLVFLNISKGVL